MKTQNTWLLRTIIPALFVAATAFGQSRAPESSVRTTASELDIILDRVSERVNNYYADLLKLAWTDSVRQQTLKEDRTPKDKPRDLVYDVVIRHQPPVPGDDVMPFYIRALSELKLIDGKPAGKNAKPQSTDPPTASMGWAMFLLQGSRASYGYRFPDMGRADLDGRSALTVEVTFPQHITFRFGKMDSKKLAATPHGDHPQVIWQGDSFEISGIQATGRIWIDAESYDLLRIELLTIPFEFDKPNGRGKLKFEFEQTARFKPMIFENPKQTLMVPESMETVKIVRGSTEPILRTVHSFSNFKRFSAGVQIIGGEIESPSINGVPLPGN